MCFSVAAWNSFAMTLFATEKSQRVKVLSKLEIESDEIEFELFFHMLLLFSASPLGLSFSPASGFPLRSSPHLAAQFVHHPLK